MAMVGVIFLSLSASKIRQNPTRIPYSCQAQFARSGIRGWPMGGGSTVRGMALAMVQCSTFTMTQTASFLPLGSLSEGLPAIGLYGARSLKRAGLVFMLSPEESRPFGAIN